MLHRQTAKELEARREQLHLLIQERSPFDKPNTERILHKHFSHIQRLVRLLSYHHSFHRRKVLELGCAYGQCLLYWGEGSEGADIREDMMMLPKALGRATHVVNVEESPRIQAGS